MKTPIPLLTTLLFWLRASVKRGGEAVAAIQGLNQKLEERLQEKGARLAALERSVAEMKKLVSASAPVKGGPR